MDNGSRDGTGTGLRRFPWVEVVAHDENLGFAAGCNSGAAVARGDVIVFLNNDTILPGGWLDPLVASIGADVSVGAAGPRSNFVSGRQMIEGVDYSTTMEMSRFAAEWAARHRGQTTEVDRLVGFCLAVRRSAFEEVGGFDDSYGIGGFEDDDLCLRLRVAGRRLLICHDSFVHHEGHRTFDHNDLDWAAEQETNRERFEGAVLRVNTRETSVSACVVVHDQRSVLPGCLDSLGGLADEVVVYDATSCDIVKSIAPRSALVLDGHWDGDGARARNDALAHCRGEWVLWIEADELLSCGEPGAVRRFLTQTEPGIDAWAIPVDRLGGSNAASVHHAPRLFRRSRCEWSGRIGEVLIRRDTGVCVSPVPFEAIRVRQKGGMDAAPSSGAQPEQGWRLAALGRAYLAAGLDAEAVSFSTEALRHASDRSVRREAIGVLVRATAAAGRLDEACAWIGRLREESETALRADYLQASVIELVRDPAAAVELLDGVRAGAADDDGFVYTAALLEPMRAQALFAAGRQREAGEVLVGVLEEYGKRDDPVGSALGRVIELDQPVAPVVAAYVGGQTTDFMIQVARLPTELADLVLDAYWQSHLPSRMVLDTVGAVASSGLSIDRVLVWSARARSAGLDAACPLIALACDPRQPIVRRARAAATAVRAFGDPRAVAAFDAAAWAADPGTRQIMEAETAVLCPGLGRTAMSPLLAKPARRVDSSSAQVSASIVVPCLNNVGLTLQCLQSLRNTLVAGTCEVILVDNGSTDATAELRSDPGEGFRVIRNEKNLGFARASNQGASAAGGRHLIFLNNDTVATEGWLEEILAPLEEPDVAIVGARLLFADGTIQHAGVNVGLGSKDGLAQGFHAHYRLPGDHLPALRPADVAAVTGAAMAVRRDAWEAVGGFHEGYWNGNEDVDLCLAVLQSGWRIRYQPTSVLYHHESMSGPDRWNGYARNVALFNERWAGWIRAKQQQMAPAT